MNCLQWYIVTFVAISCSSSLSLESADTANPLALTVIEESDVKTEEYFTKTYLELARICIPNYISPYVGRYNCYKIQNRKLIYQTQRNLFSNIMNLRLHMK